MTTIVAPSENIRRLREAGVSIWLDTLSRRLLFSIERYEQVMRLRARARGARDRPKAA